MKYKYNLNFFIYTIVFLNIKFRSNYVNINMCKLRQLGYAVFLNWIEITIILKKLTKD